MCFLNLVLVINNINKPNKADHNDNNSLITNLYYKFKLKVTSSKICVMECWKYQKFNKNNQQYLLESNKFCHRNTYLKLYNTILICEKKFNY